ncbi:hypothetical protein HXZ94_06725 [Empedobacter falsenii]|uniref:hypothetical protein n=1 Tax=Empedobacter falsenii TaxID=343874 RepID=UPI002574A3A2|nr:hypothetical protein [Empedobacter falsenii]MDM1298192.1 hypothetical protein [Empedobacter falsenii]MDM1317733.1 hypothetical protein [Empedobacter falsenii]
MNQNLTDDLIDSLKLYSNLIPGIAPFFVELITQKIPNQKLDRVINFIKIFNIKFNNLNNEYQQLNNEYQQLKKFFESPPVLDLFEEALIHASKSFSENRNNYIINLLIKSFQQSDFDQIKIKHLLNTLNEINDIQILILLKYAKVKELNIFKEFNLEYNRNDIAPMLDNYELHLSNLGLLDKITREIKDSRVNSVPIIRYELSNFGRIFIQYIYN